MMGSQLLFIDKKCWAQQFLTIPGVRRDGTRTCQEIPADLYRDIVGGMRGAYVTIGGQKRNEEGE
jgi:hypothetical protein